MWQRGDRDHATERVRAAGWEPGAGRQAGGQGLQDSLGAGTRQPSGLDLDLWRLLSWAHARLCPPSASTVDNFNRQCLSCDLVGNCTYFSASFSHSADFFLLTCEGGSHLPPSVPVSEPLLSPGTPRRGRGRRAKELILLRGRERLAPQGQFTPIGSQAVVSVLCQFVPEFACIVHKK